MLSALARESEEVLNPGLQLLYRELNNRQRQKQLQQYEQGKRSASFYKRFGAIAAGLLLIVAGTMFSRILTNPEPLHYETAVGQQKTVMLNDGSVVTLNTDTKLSAVITHSDRKLYLERGEVYFEVARDKSRPFVVMVGNGEVRAVGTAFNIRFREQSATVTVTDGRVDVKPLDANKIAERFQLKAGDQLNYGKSGVRQHTLIGSELSRFTTWRQGKIIFDQQTIAEIIDEIQYYIPEKIVLARENIGEMVIGGVFETGNVYTLIDAIESSLPVHVVRKKGVILFVSDLEN